MRKIGIFLLMFVFIFTISGCKKRDEKEYRLTIKDPKNLVINELNDYYKAGTIVEVKYFRNLYSNCGVKVDDKEIKSKTYLLTRESVAKFVMPAHECVVEIYVNDEEISEDSILLS